MTSSIELSNQENGPNPITNTSARDDIVALGVTLTCDCRLLVDSDKGLRKIIGSFRFEPVRTGSQNPSAL